MLYKFRTTGGGYLYIDPEQIEAVEDMRGMLRLFTTAGATHTVTANIDNIINTHDFNIKEIGYENVQYTDLDQAS